MARESSLTGDEQPVLLLHPHWKTLIRPILIAVLVVAVALVAAALIPSGSSALAVRGATGAVTVLVLMVLLIVPLLRWRTTTYELTTKRLRTRYGIVTRRGRDIPLTRINDVSFEIVLTDIPQVEYVQATLFRLVEDEQRRLERDQRNQP